MNQQEKIRVIEDVEKIIKEEAPMLEKSVRERIAERIFRAM